MKFKVQKLKEQVCACEKRVNCQNLEHVGRHECVGSFSCMKNCIEVHGKPANKPPGSRDRLLPHCNRLKELRIIWIFLHFLQRVIRKLIWLVISDNTLVITNNPVLHPSCVHESCLWMGAHYRPPRLTWFQLPRTTHPAEPGHAVLAPCSPDAPESISWLLTDLHSQLPSSLMQCCWLENSQTSMCAQLEAS